MTTLSKWALAPGAMVVPSVIFAVAAATEGRWGGVAAWARQATFWVLFQWFNWKALEEAERMGQLLGEHGHHYLTFAYSN